jgi:hypothetical protein
MYDTLSIEKPFYPEKTDVLLDDIRGVAVVRFSGGEYKNILYEDDTVEATCRASKTVWPVEHILGGLETKRPTCNRWLSEMQRAADAQFIEFQAQHGLNRISPYHCQQGLLGGLIGGPY